MENERLRKKNLELFREIYEIFYSELTENQEKYLPVLKNKLLIAKNNLRYAMFFNKYKSLKSQLTKDKINECIYEDIKLLSNEINSEDWKKFIYELKPLLYVFIDNIKYFKFYTKIKDKINMIYEINQKMVGYFCNKYKHLYMHFDNDELKNILLTGLLESIYKYNPFIKKVKGDKNYDEVLFSGVAYNYMKKIVVEEIIKRIHIASITDQEKIRYIEYYKQQESKNESKDIYNNENENKDISSEINFFNEYISLDEYVYENSEKYTKLDLLSDNVNYYENVENKVILEKLLMVLTPEEVYAIFYSKTGKHDEEILNFLKINKVVAMINQNQYLLIAERAMSKLKNLL